MRTTVARIGWMAAALLMASGANADDRYYVLIFGSQTEPKRFELTHSWATFVRVNPCGIAAHTISWYPRSLDVALLNLFPEEGINLSSDRTLDLALRSKARVIAWGPLLIKPEVYWKSVEVYNETVGGEIRYRAASGPGNPKTRNCISSLVAVEPGFGPVRYPLVRTGHEASRYIARRIIDRSNDDLGYDQTGSDHSWLIPHLGLDRYPIEVVPAWKVRNEAILQ